MRSRHFIQVDQTLPFLERVQALDAPLGNWLDRVGLSECMFVQPDSILPTDRFVRLLELAAAEIGPELGVEIAHQSGVEQLGKFGRAIVYAGTLGHAMATASRYSRLVNSAESITLMPSPDGIRWRLSFDVDLGEGLRQIEAFAVVATIRMIRRVVGSEWDPVKIRVHPKVAEVMKRYDDLARCHIEEAPGLTEITIQRYVMGRPQGVVGDAHYRQQDLRDLEDLALPTRLEPLLRRLIGGLLPDGTPSLKMLADLVGIRPRTLQRRLSERETSLTALIDEVRCGRALGQIGENGTSVDQMARNCGYTDPTNFTRAFRRWTGCSPREYRRLQVLTTSSLRPPRAVE